MKKIILNLLAFGLTQITCAQNTIRPFLFFYDDVSLHHSDTAIVQPLQKLAVANVKGIIKVYDAAGKEYFSSGAKPITVLQLAVP